jgi:glucose/arabinose dehydrogenase
MALARRRAGQGLALLLFAALSTSSLATLPSVTLRPVVTSGLASPVELVPPGDGSGRLFIVQQQGAIKVLLGGTVLSPDFLTVPNTNGGERGLLGIAFHPDYASNRAFYVLYTCMTGAPLPCASSGAVTLARFLRDPVNPNRADPASGVVILQVPHFDGNHNGGRLEFGPDGYLYIGIGDGGLGGDTYRFSQNRCVLLGKILRIAVDGGTGYTIPPDNPYAGSSCGAGTCPEIWDFGLRNPWKFAFDRVTGDMIIGDVGQNAVEEVDFEPASSPGGVNYGWGIYEGNTCFNDMYSRVPGQQGATTYPAYCYVKDFDGSPGACEYLAGHARPILTYPHNSQTGGFSLTGGFRYRGTNPALKGYYFYADYVMSRYWVARPDRFGSWTPELLFQQGSGVANPSSFGQDENGDLYIVSLGGSIYAIDGPPLVNVTSRKTHGGAGDFDLGIDTSRAVGDFVTTEPRIGTNGGTSHLVVFTFWVSLADPGTPACVDAAGVTVGSCSVTFSGNEVRVLLDSIPENQRVQVSLSNVNGAGINVHASLGFLAGDMDGSGAVTASDILRTKGQVGQAPAPATFGYDADLSSAISSLDVDAVKARAGLSLQ